MGKANEGNHVAGGKAHSAGNCTNVRGCAARGQGTPVWDAKAVVLGVVAPKGAAHLQQRGEAMVMAVVVVILLSVQPRPIVGRAANRRSPLNAAHVATGLSPILTHPSARSSPPKAAGQFRDDGQPGLDCTDTGGRTNLATALEPLRTSQCYRD